MQTIRSIDKKDGSEYKYVFDSRMGVTCVLHEHAEYILNQTPWNTGYEAIDEIEEINNMSDKQFRLFCRNSLKYN